MRRAGGPLASLDGYPSDRLLRQVKGLSNDVEENKENFQMLNESR